VTLNDLDTIFTAKMNKHSEIATVVLPVKNGLLDDLGYPVEDLQHKAIGVVAQVEKNKKFVIFPYLALSIWLKSEQYLLCQFDDKDLGLPLVATIKELQAADNLHWKCCFFVRCFKSLFIESIYPVAEEWCLDFRVELLAEEDLKLLFKMKEEQLINRFEVNPSGMHKIELKMFFN